MADGVAITLPVEDGLSVGEYVELARLAGRIAVGVFITWTPPGEVAGRPWS